MDENKKKHFKITFQPMVGGIRKTIYKHGVSGIEDIFQKLSNVIPEGYVMRIDVKILPMIQDSHLKTLLVGDEKVGSKFDANQEIGNQMAKMSEGNKEDKV